MDAPLAASVSFRAFLDDIACLGVIPAGVSENGVSYGILQARSNDRYWLAPLAPRRATGAGLAMFQPVTLAAALAKRATLGAIGLRLDLLWARHRIRLSGLPGLDIAFPDRVAAVAYFTGTEGPHRKTAIQFMTADGRILGYGKLTRKDEVAGYLDAEAAALKRVGQLGLATAGVPRKLGFGRTEATTWLITNSRKGRETRVLRSLSLAHVDFVRELTGLTLGAGGGEQVATLLKGAATPADPAWAQRFMRGAELLRAWGADIETSFAHGDFTPWNCFVDPAGLYVFDWEYAREGYPVGFDLVRFLLSRPTTTLPQEVKAVVVSRLAEVHFAGDAVTAARHYFAALLVYAAFYQDRQLRVGAPAGGWNDADRYARLIDAATFPGLA